MLGNKPYAFISLPHERTLFSSPVRTSFTLSASGTPGFTYTASTGVVYITNQRVIYLPTSATSAGPSTPTSTSTPTSSSLAPSSSSSSSKQSTFESFSAPLSHLQDSRIVAPFFGPNSWCASVVPVANGGIPVASASSAIELKLVFKDGGAFDFHTTFETVKERAQQAMEAGSAEVHLEDLPAYEDAGAPPPPAVPAVPVEPPPGYEEVLTDAVSGSVAAAGTDK